MQVLISVTIDTVDPQSTAEVLATVSKLVATAESATTFLSAATGVSVTVDEAPKVSAQGGVALVDSHAYASPKTAQGPGSRHDSPETSTSHASSAVGLVLIVATLGSVSLLGAGFAVRVVRQRRHAQYMRQLDEVPEAAPISVRAPVARGSSQVVASTVHLVELSPDIQLATTA